MADEAPELRALADRRRNVRGQWRGQFRVDLDVRDGRFQLVSDEASEIAAPRPVQCVGTLFSSLASCFAMAVAWMAKKRRQVRRTWK